MFIDKLVENIRQKGNPSILGLDPRLEYVPTFIKEKVFREIGNGLAGAAEAIKIFSRRLIDSVYDISPAIKLQLACYEMFGHEGLKTFEDTVSYAKSKGMLVVADGKKNDIGSTAENYSAAFLGRIEFQDGRKIPVYDVDALTVNPYLGSDGIKPFIEDCRKYKKGIFVLIKTSNPSSGEIQDCRLNDGRSLFEVVAGYVREWGNTLMGKYGYSSVGAVVGATYPTEAEIIRKIIEKSYILVPGYGAQGGSARDVVRAFNKDGLGAIVSASRSLMCAYKSEKWANMYGEEAFDDACRAEAIRMRNDIENALNDYLKG